MSAWIGRTSEIRVAIRRLTGADAAGRIYQCTKRAALVFSPGRRSSAGRDDTSWSVWRCCCAASACGTIGYRVTGRELGWLDAFLNASMILTGMGPVDRMTSDAGKLFAAAYALYSGVAFLGVMGILVAPWAHRLLHRFHVEDPDRRAASRYAGG